MTVATNAYDLEDIVFVSVILPVPHPVTPCHPPFISLPLKEQLGALLSNRAPLCHRSAPHPLPKGI